MSEASGTLIFETPDDVSSVPLPGPAHVFITHIEMAGTGGFGMGRGVPKLHPVLVQSGAALFTGGVVLVALMVQEGPAQLSEKRLIEPSGIASSGAIELPAPRLRPPHVRFLI